MSAPELHASGWAAGMLVAAPVLVDQRGVRWAPTGRLRAGEALYVLEGAVFPVPLVAQSTRTELEAAGLRLMTPEQLLAAELAEQRHQLLDPAEPPVSAAGAVAA